MLDNVRISVIGLGYVGLPLAVEFSRKYTVYGFDINKQRVSDLKAGVDKTLEVNSDVLQSVLIDNYQEGRAGLLITSNKKDIQNANVFIVTVPTPIDKYNRPDLTPLYKASETVGNVLKKGDFVIYESTVYPGVTEEECVPVLEKVSGLKLNEDFFVGYSPERINPGDKEHTVAKILKITSGSTEQSAEFIDQLYKSVITAGTHKASSIKVAEAAKVIENTQRDINIAFVNELSKIFSLMEIDTHDVLDAACTKWNFLNFRPGLVGGHCIGVDPYYLAQKAQEYGYHPEIILAGRRINDGMGKFVSSEVIKKMIHKGIQIAGAKVLILGVTFKENCPDIRNTKVIDIYTDLLTYGVKVEIYDPHADHEDFLHEYGIVMANIKNEEEYHNYDAIILAVAHNEFKTMKIPFGDKKVVYDVKRLLQKDKIDGRL